MLPSGPGRTRFLDAKPAAVFLLGLLAALASSPAAAQQEEAAEADEAIRECAARGTGGIPGVVGDSAGRLEGRVRDRGDGAAVEGATVRFLGRELGAVTDDHGEFSIHRVPPGSHLVQVGHPSFTLQRDCVTIPSGRSVQVEIALTPEPVALDSLAVTVEEVRPRWLERQGFYRRAEMGAGLFFDRKDILEEDPERLSYLFRGEAGVTVDDGRIRPRHAPTTLATGPDCPVQYFVNGRRMYHLPLGVDTYQPADVEAIEAYFGESRLPAQFNVGRSACGAIVIWLRVRP